LKLIRHLYVDEADNADVAEDDDDDGDGWLVRTGVCSESQMLQSLNEEVSLKLITKTAIDNV